jgi:DNA polymerase III gamma/tau subunit
MSGGGLIKLNGSLPEPDWKEHQPVAARILERSVLGGPHQSYLFWGPEDGQMEEAAAWFTRGLCCESPLENSENCGFCKACIAFVKDINPDVCVLSPKGGIHRLETIKEARAFCSLKKVLSRHKVLIIRQAEALTSESTSSLLKILEEPPDQCIIILCTSRPELILGTIRSRLIHVRFSGLPPYVMKEHLAGFFGIDDEMKLGVLELALSANASVIPAMTEGQREASRGGQAARNEIWSKEHVIRCLDLAQNLIEYCGDPLSVELLDLIDETTSLKKPILEFLIDIMSTMLRVKMVDTAAYNAGREALPKNNQTACEAFRRINQGLNILAEARTNLSRNVNPKLTMTVTTINLLSCLSSCTKEA